MKRRCQGRHRPRLPLETRVREAPPVPCKPVAAFAHLRYPRDGTTRCAQHAWRRLSMPLGRRVADSLPASEFAQPSIRALFSGDALVAGAREIIRTEEQHSLWDGSHVRPYALTCLLLQLDNPMAPFTRSWRSDGRVGVAWPTAAGTDPDPDEFRLVPPHREENPRETPGEGHDRDPLASPVADRSGPSSQPLGFRPPRPPDSPCRLHQ